MSKRKHFNVLIAGSGGIGKAVGLLLSEWADFDVTLYLGDRDTAIAEKAADWINVANNIKSAHPFILQADAPSSEMLDICEKADILLDCLPGSLAPAMGRLAKQYRMHYVNLTEYVAETAELQEIAKGADTAFVLQTGLAPGFVNVLACHLYQRFTQTHEVEKLEYMGMKVGALSEHATSPSFYGVTWSPIGVATEYLKPAIVVRDYKKQEMASLSEVLPIIIDGQLYEESYTSGGAADLPDAFNGIVRNLDYKTLRHPGHYQWVKDLINNSPSANSADWLQQQLLKQVPVLEDDKVIVYVTVRGYDENGFLQSMEKSYQVLPIQVGPHKLKAIQSTTAAPMAECARLLLLGDYSGLVLQSQMDTEKFLHGRFVGRIYNSGKPAAAATEPAFAGLSSSRIF